MFFLGIDLGSSSVKIALVEQQTGKSIQVVQEPKEEMPIHAPKTGWAEQDPENWWALVCKGIKRIIQETQTAKEKIQGIGIAYQMHGLVLVDKNGNTLRNSIIWCDSRAIAIGNKAYATLGADFCNSELLNSPGNFTASKLRWVKENEPELYAKIHKLMLPGDFLAYKLTNQIKTTISGLSEGVFWNFKDEKISQRLLDHYGIPTHLIPEQTGTFSMQGVVSETAAQESGLHQGTPIFYRAGDQPNNALSLNVFQQGEVAATGGTSGVMYAITDSLSAKECSRVNNFAHVNYSKGETRSIGKLLCINGAGILYRWLLNNLAVSSYEDMNQLAKDVGIGADGVSIIPFGNGAERMLANIETGVRVVNLNLNRHHKGHLCRAALEGIAFSFAYGFEIMQSDGVVPKVIRTGNDNLFRSPIFSNTIATLLDQDIEVYNTTGAVGAARACVLVKGDYKKFASFMENDHLHTYAPQTEKEAYKKAYEVWKKELNLIVKH